MLEFADDTGLLAKDKSPRRYLWTDAFAVCNFLALYHGTGDRQFLDLALRLIEQVHFVLGRHRGDDTRTGWISGLGDKEGAIHPTLGGLRIGKKLGERAQGEAIDEDEEWDRDGQYYHYLTKWMYVLSLVGLITGDSTYNIWAMELARTAHAKFTYMPPHGGRKRMYWKMNIDLSYPLVPSMGQHDPLDGLVTYLQIAASAEKIHQPQPVLDSEIVDMVAICDGKNWTTTDPLGLGGLMSDACRLAKVMLLGGAGHINHIGLMVDILETSRIGLQSYLKGNPLRQMVYYRLAFRELGLSIGLHGIEKLSGSLERIPGTGDMKDRLSRLVSDLMAYVSLSGAIEQYWLNPENRRSGNWTDHKDINMVMLATSLVPEGYVDLVAI